MIEEDFKEAFKEELSDGDEPPTPTPRGHQVTTAINDIPVFDLTGGDDDDMGRCETIRGEASC